MKETVARRWETAVRRTEYGCDGTSVNKHKHDDAFVAREATLGEGHI